MSWISTNLELCMTGTVVLVLVSSFFCFIYYLKKIEKSKKENEEKLLDFFFDMDEAIHRRFDTVNQHLVGVREEIREISEALYSFEMAMIFSQQQEELSGSARSNAAKEMWKRRRAKRLEKKD